ncbi:MAG: ATP-binding protein [Ruminococcus sp.]|nr:ATP-binding protein [Candidatus Copronaster equi]
MAFSKDTYKKAEQELNRRRKKALADRELRHAEAIKKVPEILMVEEEMAQAGLATIKAVGMKSGEGEKYIERLAEINLQAQENRKILLRSAGFSENFLDVEYTCPKCEDKGFVNGFACDCFKNLLRSIEYESLCSKLPVDKCRFDNFRLDYYPDGAGTSPKMRMKSVLEYCKAYADDFHKHSPSLLLYGMTGLGKTHLSLAIAGKAVEKGFGVIYMSAQNLFNQLEKDKFGKSDSNTEEAVLNCDLLIIDDLGTEFSTQFTVAALYNIINSRELENKPTIISTNLSQDELSKHYNERIASRILSNFTMLYFDGNDIRQIKTR